VVNVSPSLVLGHVLSPVRSLPRHSLLLIANYTSEPVCQLRLSAIFGKTHLTGVGSLIPSDGVNIRLRGNALSRLVASYCACKRFTRIIKGIDKALFRVFEMVSCGSKPGV
jgi:hypothetical protein